MSMVHRTNYSRMFAAISAVILPAAVVLADPGDSPVLDEPLGKLMREKPNLAKRYEPIGRPAGKLRADLEKDGYRCEVRAVTYFKVSGVTMVPTQRPILGCFANAPPGDKVCQTRDVAFGLVKQDHLSPSIESARSSLDGIVIGSDAEIFGGADHFGFTCRPTLELRRRL